MTVRRSLAHFARGRRGEDETDVWRVGSSLRLSNVGVRRGARWILNQVNLEFLPDRRYVILGRSGSGKSTLLRLLNRLEDPAEGAVRLGEKPLSSLSVRLVRRKIGLVFQRSRPLPGSLRDNLEYPARLAGLRLSEAEVDKALSEVGLAGLPPSREAATLSGGEQQRLAVAAALLLDPEILALDEPSSALDPVSTRELAELLLRRTQEHGLRTIVVTHLRENAHIFGEHAFVLDSGRVVGSGPALETAAKLQESDLGAWERPAQEVLS